MLSKSPRIVHEEGLILSPAPLQGNRQLSVTLRRRLTLSALLPLLLSFILSALLVWQVQTLLAEAQRVAYLAEVIATVNRTERFLIDMETGLRGYQITGEQIFLERHHKGIQEVGPALARLSYLVRDTPGQARRLEDLSRSIDEWKQWADVTLALADRGVGPGRLALNAEGKRLMDHLRASTAQFVSAEEGLRAEHSATVARTTRVTIATTLGIAGLAGVCLALFSRRQITAIASDYSNVLDQVTELNATLETRVVERTRDLQETNQEMEAFTYSVAHDLRAPLRSMRGYAQALQEDFGPALGTEGSNYTRRIANAATRLDDLITDLLNYSLLGRTDLERTPVNLEKALAEARTQALQQYQKQPGIKEAEIQLEPPLPPVLAHRATLVQMLVNLLSNAVKYQNADTAPRVRVWSAPATDGRVRLWVEDNGIGIAPEYHERIFRVFERLHGRNEYSGTGIGLAIVRRGAERMGGACGVESTPGVGSRFWVELPAAPPAPSSPNTPV